MDIAETHDGSRQWVGRTPVERVGDLVVDRLIMQMIRHHSNDARDRADLLDYVLADGMLCMERFGILLRHVGPRLPFAAAEMKILRPAGRTLLCNIDFGPETGLWWRDGTLWQAFGQMPDTLVVQMPGRALRDLVTHPYLPTDISIATFTSSGERWQATLGRTVS